MPNRMGGKWVARVECIWYLVGCIGHEKNLDVMFAMTELLIGEQSSKVLL